jgi:hypothetical protein
MAALDFPNSPTNGQIYGEWQYDGTKWVSAVTNGNVFVGDTPPSSPVAGNLWWNSSDGNLYLFYNDGNSQQWVVANPATLPTQKGVTDGSNAAAGNIGEYLTAVQNTAQSVANAVWTAVISLVVPAGDWDVTGWASVSPSAASVNNLQVGGSSVASTWSPPGTRSIITGPTNLGSCTLAFPAYQLSQAASSTIYLVVYAGFSSGTCTATGQISARRMR